MASRASYIAWVKDRGAAVGNIKQQPAATVIVLRQKQTTESDSRVCTLLLHCDGRRAKDAAKAPRKKHAVFVCTPEKTSPRTSSTRRCGPAPSLRFWTASLDC